MSGKGGKEAYPSIAGELHSVPRPKVDVALPKRTVPADTIEESARVIGGRWGSSTQMTAPQPEGASEPAPASGPKAGRETWVNKRFECPPYLDKELALKSATEGASISFLILKALANDGFTVQEEDLNKDRRKYRK
jgi:hypothetical protein